MIRKFPFSILLFISAYSFSQPAREYKSYNPATDSMKVINGQAWPNNLKNFYDRLPKRAEMKVREAVWSLSEQSAGLQLRFQTNADEIIVKYVITGDLQMSHMPATGVSGIDLYSKTIDGDWLWAAGQFNFGDTVVYHFKHLSPQDQLVSNREYTLYFPLYNGVKWMQINVPAESFFKALPAIKEKPVVVYGTSIAQGACASRPGLAWTNILSRKLDRPVINLGFSGNGQLENEVNVLIAEIDAKLYILDCLPNLTDDNISTAELKKRIVSTIVQLQNKQPRIPILLTAHDGYTDEGLNPSRKSEYERVNIILKDVFDSLSAKSIKNLYMLSKEEIGQDIESMVDGVHPNDIGMMRYAVAYEKKIRVILKEPVGLLSTTQPVTQRRDAGTYDWETRHNEVLAYNAHHPELAFIGNSITHYWSGEPLAQIQRSNESWKENFGNRNPINMGFGWDRIENVLWRVYHGELDGIAPHQIVLMIGTNNLSLNTNTEILTGLRFLIKEIQSRQPGAQIVLMGILPRREMENRIIHLNALIAKIPGNLKMKYADPGKPFLNQHHKIIESLFSDGLHPNDAGYKLLGKFIKQQLD